MPSKRLAKPCWKIAVGASTKPKRLKLLPDKDGNFKCIVQYCDGYTFKSQRGCRKHIFNKHGWYYYFDEKPKMEDVLPEKVISSHSLQKTNRSNTKNIPSFVKSCTFGKSFKRWLMNPAGGLKGENQADQICVRVLKYLKYCCTDSNPEWDIPLSVIDYCIGSINLLSDFIDNLKETWNVGYSGIIGYMNSLSHLLDFRRFSGVKSDGIQVFMAAEIYLSRVKKCLAKNMKAQWNIILSVEYLSEINCWATLDELQEVIPYHGEKFSQLLINASTKDAIVPAHDLSFCTAYLIAVLFLMVKATRPMTFIHLTIKMIENIKEDGFIDQTVFKTSAKYGFDTLIFSKPVIHIINGYITCIRPRLNPICGYLLCSRNGTQLTRISDIFGRLVFQAIGKYIHPTRYRQIVETESAKNLTLEEQQALSEDQKHTSFVAKVHYQKLNSRDIAEKGKQAMAKLRDDTRPNNTMQSISESITSQNYVDFQKKDSLNEVEINPIEKQNINKVLTKKKVPFSKIEDRFLISAFSKYKAGKWTTILSDPEYSFHPSRRPSTLFARAKLLKLI